MALLEVIAGIFKPISDVIDHIVPSGDEKVKLQEALLQGQIATSMQAMDYEKQLLDAQSRIVTAEATGQSWLQRNWRPITMMVFLVLTVCDSFGWLPNRLAPQAWTLLQIGLGGYVVGRSVEKIAPTIANAISGSNGK